MKKENTAILLVSFGSADKETRERSIGMLEKEMALAFPHMTVRSAYVSPFIRKAIFAKTGETVLSVEESLETLSREGFTTVICQPTYVIAGDEYETLQKFSETYADRFETIKVGYPLMPNEGCNIFAYFLAKELNIQDDMTYVLVGHGTEHKANRLYLMLEKTFHAMGYPNVVVGTLESTPTKDDVLRELAALHAEKVAILPLLTVAGNHVTKDVFGEENSYYSAIREKGYDIISYPKGLAEWKLIRSIFIESTRTMLYGS